MKRLIRMGAIMFIAMLTGCATTDNSVDYTAFRESKPASILVLPPLNSSVEAGASQAVLAQATLPLAESGYYVLPVAVVDETFKQNGMFTPDDIHALSAAKLYETFGADAALYIDVKRYGSSYAVVSSSVVVEVEASLVDLRSGAVLWNGKRAVAETSGSGGGLIGMLVQAVVSQIVNTLSNRSYQVAGATSQSLFTAGQPGGLLFGPRSPKYELN